MVALSACSSERPEGAYTPSYPDGGDDCAPTPGIPYPCGEPDASEGGDDAPGDDVDGTDDVTPDFDAGAEPDTGPIDPGNPLAKLAGRYAMRIDYYSTASGTTAGVTLRVKNRVSNLFLTTLTPGDGALQANEQLCLQSSAHQCDAACKDWTTLYDTDLPPIYAAKSKIERAWTIDAASLKLKVGSAALPLGFDPIDAALTLPTDTDAMNVWRPGTTGSRVQRGLHTRVKGVVGPFDTPLNCDINSALVFATDFEGTLPNLDDGLNGYRGVVGVEGQKGEVIDATGEPSQFCSVSALKTGSGTKEQVFVSLVRTSLSSCPTNAAAFDKVLGPPSGTSLDPPR
ncbi:MAG TPA: hypothetical protein VFX59_13155 [Polyangiales bacterium]|nr:hypothetical protein [Polyangiales bacterium]